MFSVVKITFGLGLALSARAGPVRRADNSTASSGLPTCPTNGALICNGPSQFGLCNFGNVIWQAVALGTMCSNGQIVAAEMPTVTVTVTATQAACTALYSAPPTASASGTTYHAYTGNGELSVGWPAQSEWHPTFDAMYEANMGRINSSCADFNQSNNSPSEIASMKAAIQQVANVSGVDARFILAVGLEESGMCSRAPTTKYSVSNPGLFQSHDGNGTCNSGTSPALKPCPDAEITQMVRDGVLGTASSGEYSLQGTVAASNATNVSKYYKAARIYNSGSIPANGDLGGVGATSCYASDIANRLVGWSSGPSGCTPKTP